MRIKRIFGIAGVALDAPSKARIWGKRFNYGLIFVFALLAWRGYQSYYISEHDALTIMTNWLIWLYFLTELIVICYLVEDKKRYLFGNWANWIIIVFGFPLLLTHSAYVSTIRLIRPLLLMRFSKSLFESSIKILAKRHWYSTMGVLILLLFISAMTLSFIDPAFHRIGDGVWFAWETVTTVGYGDLVPSTTLGRLFTGFIILIGLILISMVIASFSMFIIDREDPQKKLESLEQELKNIITQLNRIEAKLDEK